MSLRETVLPNKTGFVISKCPEMTYIFTSKGRNNYESWMAGGGQQNVRF